MALQEQNEKAVALLDEFSAITDYRHGAGNPRLAWLRTCDHLEVGLAIDFLNFWYPVSRHQPQILLLCAAAHTDRRDRAEIMLNYAEEDGLVKPGDDPHYDLLQALIEKLGGQLAPNPHADALIRTLHATFHGLSAEQASGVLAAIEHPALDISSYLQLVVQRCGFGHLLADDLYLTIHVDVEPLHILGSHRAALRHMRSRAEEVVGAFSRVMDFWGEFWRLAFATLAYPGR